MRKALIVAAAQNGVIGRNNQLPWYLPEDLKYFKATTLGKPIVMGRKTYESIGKPLPGRTNIVISRNPDYAVEGVKTVTSLERAFELAENVAFIDGAQEVMVIGGAQIYAEALNLLGAGDRLYLTKVHSDVDGDAYFTDFDESDWQLLEQIDHEASGNNPYDYSFCVYEKQV